MKFRHLFAVSVLLGLLAAAIIAPGVHLASDPVERLANGDFEAGFYATPAGLVANGWNWFHNAGRAAYGFYDETWSPVVYHGVHGVLIEINTKGMDVADADRYAGIYQTVAVVPGETYELSLHGMLRALAGDGDRAGYNYRLQYGIDYEGGTDWLAVDEWFDVPWDTVYPRLEPGDIDSFDTTLTATGPRMTLFLRGWKKWATTGRELDVNLDAVSLRGAMPATGDGTTVSLTAPDFPVAGSQAVVLIQGRSNVGITRLELYAAGTLVDSVEVDAGLLSFDHELAWTPKQAGPYTLRAIAYGVDGHTAQDEVKVTVGERAEFVVNGSFEQGFQPTPHGMRGAGWGWFTNGGNAEFGFYDETWAPVVYDGEHSQLIEISTYGLAETQPDRYAGICQQLGGLAAGATYRLSLRGMLRIVDDGATANDYRLQWAYAPYYEGAGSISPKAPDSEIRNQEVLSVWNLVGAADRANDAQTASTDKAPAGSGGISVEPDGGAQEVTVDDWIEVPWKQAYPRLDPGEMLDYETTFEAPSTNITLCFRAWKKWATVEREFDLNLDAISVTGYKATAGSE